MRTAAISVADARTAALAAMMLEGLEMHTFRHDSSLNRGGPDADLWVAQNAQLEAIESFIARESHRQAVVIGATALQGPSYEAAEARPPNGRVSVVPISAPPSTLRDALSAAIASFGEANDPVEIPDSGDS
jgi:hypothetical protein